MFENQLQTRSIQSSSQMLNQTQNDIKNFSKLEEGRDNKSHLPEEARTGAIRSIMESYCGIELEYEMERRLCRDLELNGLKPEVCKQHNRVVVLKCLNCPKNEKYLCCICMEDCKKHKDHKAIVIDCSEEFEK